MTRNTRMRAQQLAATQNAVLKREKVKSTAEDEDVVVGLAAAGAPERFDGEIKGVEASSIHPDVAAATNLENPSDLKKVETAEKLCFSSNKKIKERMRLAAMNAISGKSQTNSKAMGPEMSHKEAVDDGSIPVVPYIEAGGDAVPVSSTGKVHESAAAQQLDNLAMGSVSRLTVATDDGSLSAATFFDSGGDAGLNSSPEKLGSAIIPAQQTAIMVNPKQFQPSDGNQLLLKNSILNNGGLSSIAVFGVDSTKQLNAKQVISQPLAAQSVVNMQGGDHSTVSSRIPVVNMPVVDPTDCSRLSAQQKGSVVKGVDKPQPNDGSAINLQHVNNVEKGHQNANKGPVSQPTENPTHIVEKNSQNVVNPTAPSKSPWLEAVKNNRKVEFMGKLKENLEGVDKDGLGVTLTDSDVYPEEDEEAKCLIGMFNGRFPGKDMVQRMVDYWPKPCNFHFHNSGWIVFKFEEVCHLEEVLNSASFYAANQIMVVKKMPREIDFSKDEYSLVPLWVQLPNLPLCAWKEESLNKICTFIGTPLNVDKLTKDRETISFARCLIECDVSVSLPTDMILTMPSGKKRVQKILYEEKPSFCNKCKRIGHVEGNCHAISIPGETIYISRSRLEATRNRNKPSRGRSKKRFQSRGPILPTTTFAPNANTSVPMEKNADSIVNSINTDDVTLAKTTAGKEVPVSNAFGVIGSWASDSELEEGNQGNKVQGENGKAMVATKDIPVLASKVNGKKDNVHQKGNETQKGNVSKPGPVASVKGNGRGTPSFFKPK